MNPSLRACLFVLIGLFLACGGGGEPNPPLAEPTASEVGENLKEFQALLGRVNQNLGVNVFTRATAEGRRVTVTVSEAWRTGLTHEARELAAKQLQARWADLAAPSDPDKAYVTFVDLNGNKVGGSRAIAGSAIWVQD